MSARPRINGLYREPQVLEHEFKINQQTKHTSNITTKGTFFHQEQFLQIKYNLPKHQKRITNSKLATWNNDSNHKLYNIY